jgi:hypothetical protein
MPVKKLSQRQPSPEAQDLKARLVHEWTKKRSTAAQPIILEESGRSNEPLRIYVVWDDWHALSGIERSEIIMDAFEEVHGKDKALGVAVAMGLTPPEADRMGIPYQ